MHDVVVALQEQQVELAGYVSGLGHDELLTPSRCAGWTVADVLLHLAQTNEMAVASVEGRLSEFVDEHAAGVSQAGSIDEWAGALVDLQRGDPVDALHRWTASADAQTDAFSSHDPKARVQWVAGELAAQSLATTRLTETWIHTVDIAEGLGQTPEPTDRLWHTARLVWRTLPYALGQAGITITGDIDFDLVAPDGSPWFFGSSEGAPTVITGTALDLCTVAGQRAKASDTSLEGVGPHARDVLRLMRTFA